MGWLRWHRVFGLILGVFELRVALVAIIAVELKGDVQHGHYIGDNRCRALIGTRQGVNESVR